ncbi:tetratricopeptide repeat protein [Pacificoceanicola onchidii]|uniref:tetratricopeptide repeat protein n=1 Tax=Pacificoceanicola onchidii TaxID=2562685 RepID=UPI0010A64E70|nr:tetratricopeptide repeat protein [Pacificoceanicola onchidii]
MAEQPEWQDQADAADQALDANDLTAARTAFEAALTHVLPAKLWLLEAELTRREGDLVRAERLLTLAEEAHPSNFWPALKRAELLVEQDRNEEAATALDTVHARGGITEYPAFLAMEIPLRQTLSQPAPLARALTAYLPHAPKGYDPAPPLNALQAMPGGTGLAAPIYHALLVEDPENLTLRLDYAELLKRPCPPEATATGLAFLLEATDRESPPDAAPPLEFAIPLARAYRQLGQLPEEEAILTRTASKLPGAPALLRYLFSSQMASADAEILEAVLIGLEPLLTPRLHVELSAQAALALGNWDDAVRLLKPAQASNKAPHEAQMLATALIGQGRYALALRYLAFCIRRWPQARGLVSFRIVWALKLGRLTLAEAAIDAAEKSLPPAEITAHRMTLAGMRNDLEAAMVHYARLRDAAQLSRQHRITMAKLIYSLADIPRLDDIRAAIGDPLGETGGLLHRTGLAGTMSLELQLEERDYKMRGGYDKIADWRHTRPDSVIPALRLIDEWRRQTPAMTGGPDIPKRIFQYWDAATPPKSVQAMSDSWAAAEGFTYELWDRPRAVTFLREEFGPRWVQAFEMARNPAEESDLLRLCLLVKHGGVWADADDVLYGDLAGLLDEVAGLMVYREALGGALGNNIIAAAPGHPALIHAAKLVRKALLDRTAEIAWGKTGPGVLTRAIAHFLVQTEVSRDDYPLTVIDNDRLARVVAMHNPVRYKTLPSHWAAGGTRARPSQVWPVLRAALEDTKE